MVISTTAKKLKNKMLNIYKLQINLIADDSLLFDKVSNILEIQKTDNHIKKIDGSNQVWIYEIIEKNNESDYDFINNFLDLLENKFEQLAELGIPKDFISIWYLYEYDQQCNMGFDPVRLKRLGDNGINLCISCWDSGELDNDEE